MTVRPGASNDRDREVRIFASTFNAGPLKSLGALGCLEEWVPMGYDIYVIVS